MSTPMGATDFEERYLGGTAAAEEKEIAQALVLLEEIQEVIRKKANEQTVRRGFHNKGYLFEAEFSIRTDIPAELVNDFFEPGRSYPAIVRFSNSSSGFQADRIKDQRGCGVRVLLEEGTDPWNPKPGQVQDLTLSNTPTTFARDVRQFMNVGRRLAGNRVKAALSILLTEGLGEGARILKELIAGTPAPRSHLEQSYWSRTPYRLNRYAVKYQLDPIHVPTAELPEGERALELDLTQRLAKGATSFEFGLQFYQNERETPLEDSSQAWSSPVELVATVVLPRQVASESTLGEHEPDLALNPWNTRSLKPLGNLNRARRLVYQSSAERRLMREVSLAEPASD